jgi:hypothetical protein
MINSVLASAKDGGIVGARNGKWVDWRLPTAWCELKGIVREGEQAAQLKSEILNLKCKIVNALPPPRQGCVLRFRFCGPTQSNHLASE